MATVQESLGDFGEGPVAHHLVHNGTVDDGMVLIKWFGPVSYRELEPRFLEGQLRFARSASRITSLSNRR